MTKRTRNQHEANEIDRILFNLYGRVCGLRDEIRSKTENKRWDDVASYLFHARINTLIMMHPDDKKDFHNDN